MDEFLQVDDRDRWRSGIENGRYEPESEFVFVSEIEKVSLLDVDDGNQLKKMRLALLQVAVGINARFLKRPFASEKSSISEAGVPFSSKKIFSNSVFFSFIFFPVFVVFCDQIFYFFFVFSRRYVLFMEKIPPNSNVLGAASFAYGNFGASSHVE